MKARTSTRREKSGRKRSATRDLAAARGADAKGGIIAILIGAKAPTTPRPATPRTNGAP